MLKRAAKYLAYKISPSLNNAATGSLPVPSMDEVDLKWS